MTEKTSEFSADSLKQLCLSAIDEMQGKDPVAIAVGEQTELMFWLVVASGTSSRHVKAVAENVVAESKQAGLQPLGVEGDASSDWYLVDLGDVLVNIMLPATRANYDLESLWSGGDIVAPSVNER